jgi:uncharacterized protein (UPF0264 family)
MPEVSLVRLLISIRSPEEAVSALAGGADILDIKEPRYGSLGKPEATLVRVIVERIASMLSHRESIGVRPPLSMALGELRDHVLGETLPPEFFQGPAPLQFVKLGLAGCVGTDWRAQLRSVQAELPAPERLIAVAYADAGEIDAPAVQEVYRFAREHPCGGMLIDTYAKDGRSLTDHLTLDELTQLCQQCRAVDLPLALAGSLTREHVRLLAPLRPAILAVRGAACTGNQRTATVDADLVRDLKCIITSRARSVSE